MSIRYTCSEERLNAWSHAAGIAIGVAAGTVLLAMCGRIGDRWAFIGVFLYLFGMLASYISSTAYHATARRSPWRERLRRWDHSAIYWHIAGSYSPLTLVALRDNAAWGWGLFCFVWLCAVVGTAMSFARLREHSNLETCCFVGMGLSVLVAFGPLTDSAGPVVVSWIVAEGVCYITGAVFYSFNKRRYMHSVFHFFVLCGSLCHIAAVWNMLDGM